MIITRYVAQKLVVTGYVSVSHRAGPSLALRSLRAPDQLHGVDVCVVSSVLLSQQFQAGEKRLCLKICFSKSPSVPHLIPSISSFPIHPLHSLQLSIL